jgi:GT2 family glycosyltransferase
MEQKVSIIILNWNGWKDIVECLESLYQIDYPNYDVIVVDNGSEDESIEMIRKYAAGDLEIESNFFEFNPYNKPIQIFEYTNKELESLSNKDTEFDNLDPNNKLILIKNDHNSGFSEGNNIGMKFSLEILNPDYILLLNNDTVVDIHFLAELVSFANNDTNIGIVGPKVSYYDNPDKIAYIGHNVDLCNGRITDPDFKYAKHASSSVKIDFIVGCGLLVKKSVIEDIGMLDQNYFLYYEDVDWCLRARNSGYKIVYVPKSKIWHKIPLEENRSLNSYYYGNRNSFLLLTKNLNSINLLSCYIRLIFNKSILSLFLLIKGNKKASFTVIKAVYDGLRGRYGYKKLD